MLQVLQINSTKGVVTPVLIRVLSLRWIPITAYQDEPNDFNFIYSLHQSLGKEALMELYGGFEISALLSSV